ncbi:ATP-binding protein [Variovorax sp. Sphag1AA]|uniref:ATP-binding protein n=1 Tax=Variovorax sp. Sphag1AA TaxID=2587027 RepID=UPI001617DF03|nr:ATP-binding protein [Variovorax sp. Sphag1AA]MBB3177044.1 two-component system sensor histidine kinase BaeS [Variovorax sp. Sphag1AA]
MPRLTLFRKIFLTLVLLLAALLAIFTAFSWLGLQRGLGAYVAEIEIRRMDWFAELLRKHHATQGNWDDLRSNEAAWLRLPMRAFGAVERDSAIAGAPGEPPRRIPPWPPQDFRPPSWEIGPSGGEPPPRHREGPPELLPPPHPSWPPPPGMLGALLRNPDSVYRRLGLLDANGTWVVGAKVDPSTAARLPLRDGDRLIGTLVLAPLEGLETDADRAFVARQSGFVIWTGVAGLALALLLAWLLARRWFAPIDALTQGAQRIAQGRLDTRVPIRGSDELALLGRTFNDMAERLDSIEASRREWLADVAHELRTPLAAMRAEIEALQDGVRTFDQKTALRLHRQVMRLGQLVDDLRSSMRERSEASPLFVTVYPLAILKEALALARERFTQRMISLDATALDAISGRHPPAARGDARRLHQAFMNLLENTLSYTDTGGRMRIDAHVESDEGRDRLVLRFDDSPPGVPPEEMPRLFERLFRGEASRSRALGGSGLGLAICRATFEAHGGSIDAAPSPLGGLRLTVTLPLENAA